MRRRAAAPLWSTASAAETVSSMSLRFESPLRSRHLILRHVVALVVGLTFVTIGLILIARAPGDSRATVFFALALLSAIAILGGAATAYEQSNARGIIT